jgi:hypothetical protein
MKTIVGLIWFAGLILFQAANAVNNFTNPGFPSNFQIELTVGPKETPSSKQEEVLPISLASNVLGATTYSLTLSTLSCRITWAADSSQPLISLILMNGQQEIVLLNQQPNTGNYIWTPPENLPSGTYTFVIGTGNSFI